MLCISRKGFRAKLGEGTHPFGVKVWLKAASPLDVELMAVPGAIEQKQWPPAQPSDFPIFDDVCSNIFCVWERESPSPFSSIFTRQSPCLL